MCHVTDNQDYELKQVLAQFSTWIHLFSLRKIEVNIGNYGGAAFATRLTKLHRRMMLKAGRKVSQMEMPDNESDVQLAEAILEAWYGKIGKLFWLPNFKFI